MQDVPDGDWFCASCCCGACGQFILKDTSKYAEEKFISCKQCELKCMEFFPILILRSTEYLNNLKFVFCLVHIDHPSCQRYDGAGDSLDTFLGAKWFCSKDCEEVHKSKALFPFVFVNSHQKTN